MSDDLRAWLAGFVRAERFLGKYPYYAAVLARIAPVADPSVYAMAVSLHGGRFYLHVNMDYAVAHPEYLVGILLHEVHHVVLGHLTLPKLRDVAVPEMMELAMEMSANEYIEEPLPDPIVWKTFERWGIRAGQSTLERYEKLVALQREGTLPRVTAGHRVDDHGQWPQGPAPAGGVEQTRQLLDDAIEEVTRSPGAGEGEPKGARMRLAGRDPGRLVEALTGVTAPPEIYLDWKTALQMFVARARAPVHTYARPNRRFPARVGEVPGRTYSPRVISRPSLVVAIDTSMSMAADELAEIARQLTVVAEHARVTVVECDVEVTRVYGFEGAVHEVEGRGGTDLRPVFAPEFLRTRRPDGVVYFTDGEGQYPAAWPGVATLWVLTTPQDFGCPWGERARMVRAPTARAPAAKPAPTSPRARPSRRRA